MLFLLYFLCLITCINGDSRDQKKNIGEAKETGISNETFNLPLHFDAREKWHKICPYIGAVYGQGRCRSGWAISVTGVFTDRRCISSYGNLKLPISPMMLLSCCTDCCGCCGGNILNAWKFVRNYGLVSGSMNTDNILQPDDGCQPYLIKSLSKKDLYKSSSQCLQTPLCNKNKCTNQFYQPAGDKPTFFKIDSFKLFTRDRPEEIMRELLTNGPLQVSFHLYEDFREYRANGKHCPIYVHTWGTRQGDHSGQLIGWGTSNNIKYWLLVNSFGPHWGCNGTFRVSRTGHSNFEFGYSIIAPTIHNDCSKCVISTILFWLSHFLPAIFKLSKLITK